MGPPSTPSAAAAAAAGKKKELPPIVHTAATAFVKSFLLAYGLRAGPSILLKLLRIVRDPYRHRIAVCAPSLTLLLQEECVQTHQSCPGRGCASLWPVPRRLLGPVQARAADAGKDQGPRAEEQRADRGRCGRCGLVCTGPCRTADRLALPHGQVRQSWLVFSFNVVRKRALQCVFNSFHSRGCFGSLGEFKHADSLLFVLSCGQVMYAYVLRPETIPSAYYKFILKT